MSRPLVSIIIPCYRQAHYLGAAIEKRAGAVVSDHSGRRRQ